jgi:amino acid transporter
MAANLPAPAGVFTRQSSGLVRQVATRDVFFFGWQVITLSYIVFIVLAWGAYPGASMELALLLATIGGVAIAACYGLVARVYPRSGADYVFLSRTLHPAVGFTLSFSFAFWSCFYLGVNGALLCQFAVSPLLAGIGVQAHSPALLHVAAWFSGQWGTFLGGTAVLVLMGYLLYRGAGGYFRWQRWATWVSFVSLAITIVVLILAATGVLDFHANFDHLAGAGSYDKVVADGTAAGAAPAAPFSLAETGKFLIWTTFAVWFPVLAVSFSGEVKDVRWGQLVGMVGAVLVGGTAYIVLTFLYRAAFGADFLLSAAAKGVPLHAPPQVPFFTGIAGGNVLVTVLTGLWVLAIGLFITGATAFYPTRNMLAWSIDGMAPKRLADVNDRYHSPHWTILICVVLGELTLVLYSFTHLLGPISGFVGQLTNFLVVCAWCAVFPFLRREIFENSPIAWRIAGIPVLTILGVVATAFTVPIMYRLMNDTTFSLNLTSGIWGSVIVLAAGFAWYAGWTAYLTRHGVDVKRRYVQIPVE